MDWSGTVTPSFSKWEPSTQTISLRLIAVQKRPAEKSWKGRIIPTISVKNAPIAMIVFESLILWN